MRMDDQRQSDNFEDRGSGGGGLGGGGLPLFALFGLASRFGIGGIVVLALILGGLYFFGGGGQMGLSGSGGGGQGAGQVCAQHADACTFSRQVLASTEDVWRQQFSEGRLPNYTNQAPGAYSDPKLVVFSNSVNTGCGQAPSSVGPFYCPADRNLYVDPSFYEVMQQRLNAPGDFAQAYVIAHEVGHHVQNLIGANQLRVRGESENQTSVRVELQADCLAGVWGHTAQASLSIDDADLREALNAAHQIGDDTLQGQAGGGVNPSSFTHGTSAQRMRWFRRGFDSGDARQCDTFGVASYDQL